MKHKSRSAKQRKQPKTRLRLPDLEFSKTAVRNRLTSVEGMTEKAVWHVVKDSAKPIGIEKLAPHGLRHLRSALPFCGRGVGTDPVPSGPCFHPDDRALPRLQATDSISSKCDQIGIELVLEEHIRDGNRRPAKPWRRSRSQTDRLRQGQSRGDDFRASVALQSLELALRTSPGENRHNPLL
jgi:hypothetical protein